jgi:hypothetical protein
MRLAVRFHKAPTDLHKPLVDEQVPEVVEVAAAQRERLVGPQAGVSHDENQLAVAMALHLNGQALEFLGGQGLLRSRRR